MLKSSQLEMFTPRPAKPVRWQWHGREMFTELRNDFRFARKIRRVVYHLADTVKAFDEAEAARMIAELYPGAQTIGLHRA